MSLPSQPDARKKGERWKFNILAHNHPLVFIEDHQQSHEGDRAYCSGCEEVIEGPRFTCVACGFHLDKICAEAATKISHPLHSHQNLNLLQTPPNASDLSICTENLSEELKEAKCFVCWKPLLDSAYLSPDFGFYLHKKCIELPLEIHHPSHRPHSLFLQVINDVPYLPCEMCREIQPWGLVYACSICEFVLHIECVSLSLPTFEDTSSHEHQFTRLWLRQSSFTCDACGSSGDSVSYICSTCSLIVHKKCISLPRIVKSLWHHHPMFHKYFVADNEAGTLECAICHEEVNKECESYYCSDCKFILHVNCALRNSLWYNKIESKDDYEKALVVDTGDSPFVVIKDGENVMNTEIKHFSHQHNLVSSEVVKNVDRCRGCDFNVHMECTYLPQIARHKCDEHVLTLTYHDDNDYSKHHYCDICEEKRNTNIWFYHCAICDTSAHTKCVFGGFPFIKLGTTRLFKAHPHHLVLVKKDYEYPECYKLCGKPCSDLALECAETRCNYIIHFKKCVG
ncbi:hypothetical protein PTKIN_Ptkin16aG0009500 [Pterospermum kingtungense]